MINEWSCQNIDASTTDCVVTASTTVDIVMYQDWILVNAVVVFMISFLTLGYFFNWLKK